LTEWNRQILMCCRHYGHEVETKDILGGKFANLSEA
jgi:hypothetical protein